jgi:hypothetical protein
VSRAPRYSLAEFSVNELRDELDRRARAVGKPAHQWDEKRSVYMRRLAVDYRTKLAEVEANGTPGGYSARIHSARIRALKDQIAKYERNAGLAEADEIKAAAARKRG